MKTFPKIDMAEVTRLTRAGKLAEAMAALQGRATREAAGPKSTPSTRLIEGPARADAAPKFALRPDFALKLKALGESLPRIRPFVGYDEGARRPVRIPQGARFEERSFANAAGARSYKVYVPSGYKGQALPVVVMLHGCTQNPDDFAAGTRMNEVAEERQFLVVYPHQPQSANPKKCWNWFHAADQRREGGEPSLIAGVALQVVEAFSADPSRVYVAGLSAGGAAAAILATTHRDVFAAAGVHSGLACGAARDMPSAFAAMAGKAASPARAAAKAAPTIVFHGDADRTVHVVNADHVAAQARPRGPQTVRAERGRSPDGVEYTRTVRCDEKGRAVLEQWVLHGAGHAWSGGSEEGSYASASGPDASREMIRFFLQHTKDV